MAESTENNPTAKSSGLKLPKITRADFIGGGVGALAGAIFGNELNISIEGPKIETKYAVFHPCYEGISGSSGEIDLPKGPIDIHWVENILASSDNVFKEGLWFDPKKIKTMENLRRFSRERVLIAGGDVHIGKTGNEAIDDLADILRPFPNQWNEPNAEGNKKLNYDLNFYAHFYTTFLLPLRLGFNWLKSQDLSRRKQEERITRRQMLTKTGFKVLDAAALYMSANTLVSSVWLHSKADERFWKAADRIAGRLYSLLSHTKPFDVMAFLRSVIWSRKLLDLSEKESSRLGRKVNINYQVGEGHMDMEDFLILGKDVCGLIIKSFPHSIFKRYDSENTHSEAKKDFAGTILIGTKEGADGANYSDWQERRVVVDEELTEIFLEKISH